MMKLKNILNLKKNKKKTNQPKLTCNPSHDIGIIP